MPDAVAAFQLLDNKRTWFLKSTDTSKRYVRIKLDSDSLELAPKDITEKWSSFPGGAPWPRVDTFLRDEPAAGGDLEKTFVFSGNQVIWISVRKFQYWQDALLHGPHDIDVKWKALDIAGFSTGVDAAFFVQSNATSSEAWFFKKNYLYTSNDFKTFVVKGPAVITTVFKSLLDAGFDSVDCVLSDPTTAGQYWFFKDKQAVKISYDANTHESELLEGPTSIHTLFPVSLNDFYPD
ncbi:hypothetical protein DXG01_003454 [Tephrocybe rancida]|nr:hypothetical protein DXG01_003454 [Tephrocybe rancida]